jgi:hypothetical protein
MKIINIDMSVWCTVETKVNQQLSVTVNSLKIWNGLGLAEILLTCFKGFHKHIQGPKYMITRSSYASRF